MLQSIEIVIKKRAISQSAQFRVLDQNDQQNDVNITTQLRSVKVEARN